MELDDEHVTADLLEQMNSLQTKDKGDLVFQMMAIVSGSSENNSQQSSSSLTQESAKFYLEMNRWNLEAAVCSFYDLEAGPNARMLIPSMKFVQDKTVGEGESIPPLNRFVRTWRIKNTGLELWPEGCSIVYTDGVLMTVDGKSKIQIDQRLNPSEETDIVVEMIAPREPGIHIAKWRGCTPSGVFFGDPIWVVLTVESSGTLAVTQQMHNFNAFGSTSGRNFSENSNSQVGTTSSMTFHNPFSSKTSSTDKEMS